MTEIKALPDSALDYLIELVMRQKNEEIVKVEKIPKGENREKVNA